MVRTPSGAVNEAGRAEARYNAGGMRRLTTSSGAVILLAVAALPGRTNQAAPATGNGRAAVSELPADAAQENALRDAIGRGFRVQRTPHFLIAHDVDPQQIQPFVARVEYTYASIRRFCAAHNIPFQEPSRKLEMVYFATFDAYARYARRLQFVAEGTYGFYHQPTNRAAFFDAASHADLARLREDVEAARRTVGAMERQLARAGPSADRVVLFFGDGGQRTVTRDQARKELAGTQRKLRELAAEAERHAERINRTVVQHETAHQVLFNAGVHKAGPPWLVEGLAMLFETPPTGAGSGIGALNDLRLRDFRSVLDAFNGRKPVRPDDLVAAIRNGPFVSVERLLTDKSLLESRGDAGATYYAEAWALAHYLHRTSPTKFAEYVKRISRRVAEEPVTAEDEITCFEACFGRIDEAFLRRWARFMISLGGATDGP